MRMCRFLAGNGAFDGRTHVFHSALDFVKDERHFSRLLIVKSSARAQEMISKDFAI